mgnify:CR=1 FL=1
MRQKNREEKWKWFELIESSSRGSEGKAEAQEVWVVRWEESSGYFDTAKGGGAVWLE